MPHPDAAPPRRRRSARARASLIERLEGRVLMANRIHGVDVSQWQGLMDWNKAWEQNVRFAFVRASRTNLAEDPYLDSNLPNAKARGILAGPYHYVLPMGENGDTFVDPKVDAQRYVAAAGQYMAPGYLRPVVDVESRVGQNPSFNSNGYNLNTWVAAFIAEIKRLRPGVNPLIYTGSDFAQSYLNLTSVAASPDLWIANYAYAFDPANDPVTTGSQPMYQNQVGTGPWRNSTPTPQQSWDFWQYSADGNGKGALYGSPIHSAIDLDVFNGDDINVLKQNFVIGAARVPVNPSPADGATEQWHTGLVLDWADSAGAVAYDLYLDDMATPVASNLTQSQWSAPPLAAGPHAWRVVAKGVLADDDTHVSGATWTFSAANVPLPGAPANPSPHNTFVTTKPVLLDWDEVAHATHYDLYLGNATAPNATVTVSQYGPINPLDGQRLWRVVARNAGGQTAGPQWSYTMDATPPAATYGAQAPAEGASTLDFTVTYADATSGVDFTSLDSSDVYVTGPNGYSESATLVGVDANANGPQRVATYRVAAPGGTWDGADNGTYSVRQNADQVRDIAGGSRAAGEIGTFAVAFAAPPFAYKVGSALHLDFSRAGAPIALARGGGDAFAATAGAQTLDFDGVTEVVALGTAGADVLTLNTSLAVPLTFSGDAGGEDVLEIAGGQHAFAADLGAGAGAGGGGLGVEIDAGAAAVFEASQHLRALRVGGTATLSAGGAKAIVAKELEILATGKLDLADNDLVIDYDAASPLGTIAGWVQSGRNGGAWDGASGILTGGADAESGLTTLGISEAAAALAIEGNGTANFGGETVDATAVLVKYTYAGDANLDGSITGDDYSPIDLAILFAGSDGYFNGDFNHDGAITGDDYSIIDLNILLQGVAL